MLSDPRIERERETAMKLYGQMELYYGTIWLLYRILIGMKNRNQGKMLLSKECGGARERSNNIWCFGVRRSVVDYSRPYQWRPDPAIS
ncbi:uncharacterized protein ASPGLDRAFT_733215 [Aspergillus glaucus CBS 516.65]|uniref:Uncharacterized protein n=1 Tax=Aspergillus glaucus CBS 516.65 TaxID=1160497 RepID=A0A1L9VXT3_ASPGL|nr:hypothetical protein ASPGLDRAFT_733215 [Aspergillus glaucus CBS 516.65]OJJ88721.1 hypothetical protein ASPGLDRAFT_733215 [Aspergillus glaucus CBS 516.65]